MSNIIECPACATRYKMNKAIPEGGRSVKCARCGNQWRLEPEEPAEELIELDEGENNEIAAATQHDPAPPARQPQISEEQPDSSEDFFHAASNDRQWADQHMATDDTAAEDESAIRHSPYEENASSGFTAMRNWRDEDDAAESETDNYSANEGRINGGFEEARDTGFYASSSHDAFASDRAAEMAETSEDEQHWSPQMLSQSLAKDSLFDDSESDEDAEMAVRSVLKGALANPREEDESEAVFENETDQGDDDRAWRNFASQNSDTSQDDDFEAEGWSASQDKDFSASMAAIASERSFYEDPNNEPRDEFGDDSFETSDTDIRRSDVNYALNDAAFEDEIEDAFRSGVMPHSSAERISGDLRPDDIHEDLQGADHYGKLNASEDDLDADYFDNEAASLQAELEEGSLTHIERQHKGGGGLAVAAAWAGFFSVISGVALALVSFRTEIVTALPGMGSLYQTVGFNVAASTVDFSNVSYRWTVEEGKPMIEVTGKLVNLTDQQIPVPRVLVNVRNAESNNGTQTTATVRTEPLEPREIADFTLEFLAPPTTISQIELELDRSQ